MLTNRDLNIFEDIIAEMTPKGLGAVSGLRLSGKNVKTYAESVFLVKIKKPRFSYFIKNSLDDVLLNYYKGPNSYTGEDVVEIFCHGNPSIVSNILNKFILDFNIRVALPGEFTKRAYLNSKLDLPQAEAVMDLINSNSKILLENKKDILNGGLSKLFNEIKEEILNLSSESEVELEFDEDYFFDKEKAKNILLKVLEKTENLINSYYRFEELSKELLVCIVGEPNVGKSSLFNSMLHEERALVDSAPGTTRDYIEAKLILDSYTISLIDTAGLRENPSSNVEGFGIENTKKLISKATTILEVTDRDDYKPIFKNSIVVRNKLDLLGSGFKTNPNMLYISVKNRTGIKELFNKIIEKLNKDFQNFSNDTYLITLRQKSVLIEFKKLLSDFILELEKSNFSELYSHYFSSLLILLDELLGKTIKTEILDTVFSKFCVGK